MKENIKKIEYYFNDRCYIVFGIPKDIKNIKKKIKIKKKKRKKIYICI